MDARTRAAQRRRKAATRQRRARASETPEQTAERRRRDRESKRRKRAGLAKPESAPPADLDLFDWIESTLIVPSGLLAGQPFRVEDWQRRFLRGALADGIQEAALVVARKNGKTAILAALVLAYLLGR